MNSVVKKLAGQTAIYGLSTIIGRLLNYLLTPLYTRVFLPAQYGVITEMYAYVSVLNVVYTMGMETAFFRYFSIKQNKQDVFNAAFSVMLFTTAFFTGLLWLGTPLIARLTHYAAHPEYIYMLLGIMAFDTLSAIPFALLRVQNKPRKFAAFKFLNIGVNFTLNIFFLLLCPLALHYHVAEDVVTIIYSRQIGVGYVFIANLCASAVTFLSFSGLLKSFSFKFERQLLREMLKYGLPLIIVGLAGMVNETIDRLLLKYNLPGTPAFVMAQVGIYGANYRLSILLTLFVQAFKMAAEPFFFNQASQTDSRSHYAVIMNYFVAFCCSIFLLVTLYLPLFKHFIGIRFYAGLHVVPILLLANLFLGVYYNLSIWYKLTHKNSLGAYVAIMGAIITLGVNFYFIPRYSYDASAWATFICYGCMMIVSFVQGQKYFPVPYQLGRLAVLFFTALALFAIDYWLIQKSSIGIVFQIAAGTLLLAIYCLVVVRTFRRNIFERPPLLTP